MKLCVSTLGCCEWSLNKFVGFLKDLGVSGLGIRGLDNIMDTNKFDCLKNENELTDFGKGEIPIKKIISMLKADGYDGYISFEHERKWHPELFCTRNSLSRVC